MEGRELRSERRACTHGLGWAEGLASPAPVTMERGGGARSQRRGRRRERSLSRRRRGRRARRRGRGRRARSQPRLGARVNSSGPRQTGTVRSTASERADAAPSATSGKSPHFHTRKPLHSQIERCERPDYNVHHSSVQTIDMYYVVYVTADCITKY